MHLNLKLRLNHRNSKIYIIITGEEDIEEIKEAQNGYCQDILIMCSNCTKSSSSSSTSNAAPSNNNNNDNDNIHSAINMNLNVVFLNRLDPEIDPNKMTAKECKEVLTKKNVYVSNSMYILYILYIYIYIFYIKIHYFYHFTLRQINKYIYIYIYI